MSERHNVQRANRRCAAVQHMLSTTKLWQQSHCLYPQNANLDCHESGTWPEWFENKVSGHGYGFVATSWHSLFSSAWKSTPKCTLMCWRVMVILWLQSGSGDRPGSANQRRPTNDPAWLQDYDLLITAPFSPDLNWILRLVICREITNMTSHNTKASWSPPSAEFSCRRLWKDNSISSVTVLRQYWGWRWLHWIIMISSTT